jgi:hypothetical protein
MFRVNRFFREDRLLGNWTGLKESDWHTPPHIFVTLVTEAFLSQTDFYIIR